MRAFVRAMAVAMVVAVGMATPRPVQAEVPVAVQDTAKSIDSVAAINPIAFHIDSLSVVSALPSIAVVPAHMPAPSKRPSHHSTPLVFAFAAAASRKAKKKAPVVDPNDNPDNPAPLTSKDARKVPMFVDSTVHFNVGEKGKHDLLEIKGGVMLDELEEELTDDQIDELISLKAIRPATAAEIAAADQRAKQDEE